MDPVNLLILLKTHSQAKMAPDSGRAMGSVLGLFPPLRVEESEIDTAVSAIDVICALEEQ